MITEICAFSFDSARNARDAGADRIELCTELFTGGLTPSFGLLQKVVKELDIPVYVLIRPRSGNFSYSVEELDTMLRDIQMCNELGCAGVVSGVLKKNHTVDTVATASLMEAAGDMDFTFHRAFDWVGNREEAAERLIHLGCKRILTSGGMSSAVAGLDNLLSLQRRFGQDLVVMPGGGVRTSNIGQFKEHGFREIHFSGSHAKRINIPQAPVSFMPERIPADDEVFVSDLLLLKEMISLAGGS